MDADGLIGYGMADIRILDDDSVTLARYDHPHVSGYSGYSGTPMFVGWSDEEKKRMPEWAVVLNNAAVQFFQTKMAAAGGPSGNLYFGNGFDKLNDAFREFYNWWVTESFGNPTNGEFITILSHWLAQDPRRSTLSQAEIFGILWNMNMYGQENTGLTDLIMAAILTGFKERDENRVLKQKLEQAEIQLKLNESAKIMEKIEKKC